MVLLQQCGGDLRGEAGQGRVLEQGRGGHGEVELVAQGRGDPGDGQRVAAEGEEAGVALDLGDVEDAAPQLGDELLDRSARRPAAA